MRYVTLIIFSLIFSSCTTSTNNKEYDNKSNDKNLIVQNPCDSGYISVDSLLRGFPKLKLYFDSLENSLMNHNWDMFLSFCDLTDYKEQINKRLTKEQYILEVIHLRANNTKSLDINQIKEINILCFTNEHSNDKFIFKFKGNLIMNDSMGYNFCLINCSDEKGSKLVRNLNH